MMRLSLNEARELVNRKVLDVNVDISIANDFNEYIIDKIIPLANNLMFKISRRDESKTTNITYEQIVTIAGQAIKSVLEAYDMGPNGIVNISEKTNVRETVIGKDRATLSGKELEEGVRIFLKNDSDQSLCNKILNVKRDDKGLLKLVANRGRPKNR